MKKKINSKRSYKKGGEAWVSEKMANLPMYKIAGMVPQSIDLKLKPFGLQPEKSQLDPNNLTMGQDWAASNPLPQMQQIGNKKGFSYDINAANSIENFKPSDALKQEEVQEYKDYTTSENEGEERQPFFNPYGGYDLATSAGMLGQSIKEKNTLGIVGSSAKLLTGLGRNVMGGMGLANRENFIQGEYDENVRNSQRPRTMAIGKNGGLYFMQGGGEEPDEVTPVGDPAEVAPDADTQRMLDQYAADKAAGIWDGKKERQYDSNSAADTWEQKTGTSWSEAKRLGYTDGSAKDNQKLLSELNDERFRKEAIRSSPLKSGRVSTKTPSSQSSPQLKEKEAQKSFQEMTKHLPKGDRSQGNIGVHKEKSTAGRVVEVLANPFQSFGHYAKYGELPAEDFSKAEGNENGFDAVVGAYNPASWANYAANAVDYAEQGDYGRAGMSALGAVPVLGKLKYTKYIPFKQAQEALRLAQTTSKGVQVVKKATTAVGNARKMAPINNYFTPELSAGVKQGQKALPIYNGAKSGNGYITGSYRPYQDGGYFQEGGEQPQGGQDQMMQQVAQALQGGAPPEEVLQQLVQAGVPQEQAVQMIQGIMQQLQGQQQEQPQEEQMMRSGGYHDYAQYADKYFQEGGEQSQQPSPEQIIQAYAQSVQQDPQEIMQQLQQMQPEEQQQALQQMMSELQGGQQEQQVMRRGGQIAKKLTGEYTLEEEENPNVNSEIEHNEYVQTPDGKVTKADGNTHEKGGIEVELEPGTRIVSDHLKLGAKNAKHYKEDFDLEVKASDTYAKVIKRFTTKSGLQKIIDEQEKVIAQLKKSEEAAQGSTMSESTAALNKQFLSEKLHSLEQEKAPLEEARKALLEDVFNLQEESKPAEKKEQNEFQNGGYMDLANQYGVSPERAQELVRQYQVGGQLPKYQDGKEPYGRDWTIGNQKQRYAGFLQEARLHGYEGDLNGSEGDINKSWGELQAYMRANKPAETEAYARQTRMTAKGVGILKGTHPDLFKALGLPLNKGNAEYSEEETNRLKDALEKSGTTPKDFWLEQFNDNLGAYRFPVMPLDLKAAGIQSPQQQQQITTTGMPNPYQAPQEQVAITPEEVEQERQQGKGAQFLNLPDQSPMMPDSLTGALKLTRRYDRVDPMRLTSDGQISELQGQANQAMQNINLQPGAEAAVAGANISAITQQNIAKTNSEVNRANMGQDAQAQQFNAQVQMQEENARGVDLKDYESKIYQAQAITDANIRGYYNQLKAADLANYNAVNNVNAMNQMYDHFGYTNDGVAMTGDQTRYDVNNYLKPKEAEKTKRTRTKSARFGGKIK